MVCGLCVHLVVFDIISAVFGESRLTLLVGWNSIVIAHEVDLVIGRFFGLVVSVMLLLGLFLFPLEVLLGLCSVIKCFIRSQPFPILKRDSGLLLGWPSDRGVFIIVAYMLRWPHDTFSKGVIDQLVFHLDR